MTTQPLAIVGSGMVCGVGLSAPSACAAIRCGVDNFQETRFMDAGGEWIMGSSVPLEQPWRGATKLVKMLTMALRECIACDPTLSLEQVPILLCVAEKDRPGRLTDLENLVFKGAQEELGVTFHARSEIISEGRVGVASALLSVRELLYKERFLAAIIVGVDSLLIGQTLKIYEEWGRLLTSKNSNGFIPGESASAVLVQRPKNGRKALLCVGLGLGEEKATVLSENLPLRADGLVAAIHCALADASYDLGDTDFRITDISGEQYFFKEAAIALSRTLRRHKEEYDLWHPADCIGEVGAAIGPAILTVILAAMRKNYCPGNNVLGHLSNDGGMRVAMILSHQCEGAV